MTFPLTNAGRDNLEAILAEFERAGRFYPPLYHERLIACEESDCGVGGVHLSETEWQAFIDAQSNDLNEGEWSQWDGPYWVSLDYRATCLGRWFGDPDGLQEFINLANSVTEVLKREDFSSVDGRYLSFSFGSWREWLSTIHSWAFQFQMPLLSSDMTLWGAEDFDQDDFYELAEQMSQTGDVAWPLHPVKWSLTYNVFTSSTAAIRAILRPETVIGVNEPWPTDKAETYPPPEDLDDIVSSSCHRLVFGPMGWCLKLADADRQIWTRYQAGLHRIAHLVENEGVPFKVEDLSKFGGRNFREGGLRYKRSAVEDVDTLAERKDLRLFQYDIDKDGIAPIEERFHQLAVELEVATLANDENSLAKIQKEIALFKKTYFMTPDGKVVPKPIQDPQAKRDRDKLRGTMNDALGDLKQQFPEHFREFTELEEQLVFEDRQFTFEPNPGYTHWRVVRKT